VRSRTLNPRNLLLIANPRDRQEGPSDVLSAWSAADCRLRATEDGAVEVSGKVRHAFDMSEIVLAVELRLDVPLDAARRTVDAWTNIAFENGCTKPKRLGKAGHRASACRRGEPKAGAASDSV
jgi:hypothetical protein